MTASATEQHLFFIIDILHELSSLSSMLVISAPEFRVAGGTVPEAGAFGKQLL